MTSIEDKQVRGVFDILLAALIAWVVAIAAVPAIADGFWRITLIALTTIIVIQLVRQGVVIIYLSARRGAHSGRVQIEDQIEDAVEDRDRQKFDQATKKLQSTARLSSYDYNWAVGLVAETLAQLQSEVPSEPELSTGHRITVAGFESGYYQGGGIVITGRKAIYSFVDALQPYADEYFAVKSEAQAIA